MVRSVLLRGFDQQMAEVVGKYMEGSGIKFIHESVPVEVTQIKEGSPGELKVKYIKGDGSEAEEVYNTVLFAIGRDVNTANIDIEKSGVKINPKSVVLNFVTCLRFFRLK